MQNFIIRRVTVGFGFTSLPSTPGGGQVLKYYIEPEIEFEQPATASAEEMQTTLDGMTAELLTMVQQAVKKKVLADQAAKAERNSVTSG